jgi:hypothetical protein
MDFKNHMKTPNSVFSKEYDNYFLFTDNEIVLNNLVYEKKLKQFSSCILGHDFIIELVNLQNNETIKTNNIYRISNTESFNVLSHVYIDKEKTFEDLLFEFLIYDDTREWEIYCHIGNDYGLGGCTNLVYDSFIKEIMPYENLSFENKLIDIGQNFTNELEREYFIKNLLYNYNFKIK